ncbi:MAG: iron-only hydrogenase system regulator [Firmicutes bacterium]|nr:iron-only hydrogenase system regulator [Bacillota bacterium]
METRIAAVSIIVENQEVVEKLNSILHDYNQYIIGRLGLPYRQRGIFIICIVLDAPNDVISALSGKLGMLPNVTAKTVYSKPFPAEGGAG